MYRGSAGRTGQLRDFWLGGSRAVGTAGSRSTVPSGFSVLPLMISGLQLSIRSPVFCRRVHAAEATSTARPAAHGPPSAESNNLSLKTVHVYRARPALPHPRLNMPAETKGPTQRRLFQPRYVLCRAHADLRRTIPRDFPDFVSSMERHLPNSDVGVKELS